MHSNKIIRDPLLQTQFKTHAMPEISTVLRDKITEAIKMIFFF